MPTVSPHWRFDAAAARSAIKARGMTHEAAARAVPIPLATLQRWLGGVNTPSTRSLFALAQVLDVDPADLMILDDDPAAVAS